MKKFATNVEYFGQNNFPDNVLISLFNDVAKTMIGNHSRIFRIVDEDLRCFYKTHATEHLISKLSVLN